MFKDFNPKLSHHPLPLFVKKKKRPMYGDFETYSSLSMLFHNAMWTKKSDAENILFL